MTKTEIIYNQYRDIMLAKGNNNPKFAKPFSELTKEEVKEEEERQTAVMDNLKSLLFG